MRFLLLVLIDVVLFVRLTLAQEPVPHPVSFPAESAIQEYADPANGVSFRYPGTWHLNQGGGAYIPPVILKNTVDPTDPYKPTAYVALVGRDAEHGPYSNSNFINAWFLYRIAPGLNQEQCYAHASAPLQNSNESDNWKLDWRTIDGIRFRRGTGTDGGLCNETTEDFYSAFHDGRCYLFEKQLNTVCQHSDGLRDVTPGELARIIRQLDGVMLSVRFTRVSASVHDFAVPNYIRTIHLLETGVQQHWDPASVSEGLCSGVWCRCSHGTTFDCVRSDARLPSQAAHRVGRAMPDPFRGSSETDDGGLPPSARRCGEIGFAVEIEALEAAATSS
jgi:hypothetical protein